MSDSFRERQCEWHAGSNRRRQQMDRALTAAIPARHELCRRHGQCGDHRRRRRAPRGDRVRHGIGLGGHAAADAAGVHPSFESGGCGGARERRVLRQCAARRPGAYLGQFCRAQRRSRRGQIRLRELDHAADRRAAGGAIRWWRSTAASPPANASGRTSWYSARCRISSWPASARR